MKSIKNGCPLEIKIINWNSEIAGFRSFRNFRIMQFT
jgi:hypothetical protein